MAGLRRQPKLKHPRPTVDSRRLPANQPPAPTPQSLSRVRVPCRAVEPADGTRLRQSIMNRAPRPFDIVAGWSENPAMNGRSTFVTDRGVEVGIRPVRDEDVEALLQLTLAAFVPVFRSFQAMLGPAVYDLIWPDWRASQRKDVETLCRDCARHVVWVAEADAVPVGFIAYDLNRAERTAEVQLGY